MGDDFEDSSEEFVDEQSTTIEESISPIVASGNLAFKAAYGYLEHSVDSVEYSGLNQAQVALYLQVDAKISQNWKFKVSGDTFYDGVYDIHSRKNYSSQILTAYETQLRLDETYLEGSLSKSVDLKVGRQVVVWGKSDTIRITDVINPLDNRLPGMTDIEDLRLPTTMAKLDYYLGEWNFSAMAIFESRIMQEAPPNSEFFPLVNLFATAPRPFFELIQPENSLDNMQYAFAINGIFSGLDISFYAANVLDQKWHIENNKRVLSKVNMLGSAINIVQGSWLLKSELALINGVKYNSTADEKDRVDLLVGFDYMGLKDTVISLELSNRHIFDYENKMINTPDYVDEDEVQTALRLSKSLSNDTVNVNALLSMFGNKWQNGGFARIWTEIDLQDALVANIGVVDYIGGERAFLEVNSYNDKIFADITYSF